MDRAATDRVTDGFVDRGEVAQKAGRQIVENPHAMPCGDERFDQMRADEPGAAGDETGGQRFDPELGQEILSGERNARARSLSSIVAFDREREELTRCSSDENADSPSTKSTDC